MEIREQIRCHMLITEYKGSIYQEEGMIHERHMDTSDWLRASKSMEITEWEKGRE